MGSKETIDPGLTKALVHKLRRSCGQLETKISKIDQLWVGKIDKLLYTLNVQTPCRYTMNNQPKIVFYAKITKPFTNYHKFMI